MRQNGNPSRNVPQDLLGHLSPKRQELIRPVLEHPQEYVLLSLRGLARKLKADPMTTLRVIRDMGFTSYPIFQKYLHELSVSQATMLDLVQSLDSDIPSAIRESVNADIKNLQALRNTVNTESVLSLVKQLYKAQHVVILASDQATCLATLMQYTLAILGIHASTCVTAGQVVNTVRTLGRRDLVIAISFGRGLMQTVEGLKRARAKGAHCVGITDTHISPIARYSHQCFLSSIESPSFAGSYAAPVALLNGILVACTNYRKGRTISLLEDSDKEHRTGFRWYRDAR
jgi:RpiR family carbohydrate utilization transcriptional regulator